MRINVYISSSGFCSRRQADRYVEAKEVFVNGKVCEIGYDVLPDDEVYVQNHKIIHKEKTIYMLYHKPVGIETTTDQSKKNNIIDAIHYPTRIFPVGRLDKDSSGLIILTNDGQIVNKILRSENHHEKEYIVKVDHPISSEFILEMRQGVKIYNPVKHTLQITKETKTTKIDDHSFSIVLTEGLNLQIRRMCKQLGYRVIALHRVRIMDFTIEGIRSGSYRLLSEQEIKKLMAMLS